MIVKTSGSLCHLAHILLSSPLHGRFRLLVSQSSPCHQG